jgi:hypothetical protein
MKFAISLLSKNKIMNKIVCLLFMLVLFGACKKESIYNTSETLVYPNGRGMIATVGKDSFNATSMDAHVHYQTNSGKYSMDMGVMDKATGQIMSFSVNEFEYGAKRYDFIYTEYGTAYFWQHNRMFTTFDNVSMDNCNSGYFKIESIEDNEMKGSFKVLMLSNKMIVGTFRYQLIYPVDTLTE